jgi:hypothetical protein
MGQLFGLLWLIMILAVPVAFVYFLVKGMWLQTIISGLFLLAIGGTLWLVTGLKHG